MSTSPRSRHIARTLACVATIALTLLATASYAADPILIGFSAPLTGDAAGSGQESLDGAGSPSRSSHAKGGILVCAW